MQNAQISLFDPEITSSHDTANLVSFPTKPKAVSRKPHKAQPITDKEVLASIKASLLSSTGRYGLRNYTIFVLALNTGLRMNDVLNVHLRDIWDFATDSILPFFSIKESKTGKYASNITLSETTRSTLKEYILTMKHRTPDTPLFPSQKKTPKSHTPTLIHSLSGEVIATHTPNKNDTGCMERKSYWRILHSVALALGVQVSCHTPRKTFARFIYDSYKGSLVENQFTALDLVQQMLRHSSSAITLRYIGITDEIHNAIYSSMQL